MFGTHADRRQQDGPDSSEQCGGGGCPCTCSGSTLATGERACRPKGLCWNGIPVNSKPLPGPVMHAECHEMMGNMPMQARSRL